MIGKRIYSILFYSNLFYSTESLPPFILFSSFFRMLWILVTVNKLKHMAFQNNEENIITGTFFIVPNKISPLLVTRVSSNNT